MNAKNTRNKNSHYTLISAIFRVLTSSIFLGTLLAGASFFYSQQSSAEPPKRVQVNEHEPTAADDVEDIYYELGPNLSTALIGAVKPEQFEKLDFSVAGDPGFGSNPAMEVFNPAGRIIPAFTTTATGQSVPMQPQKYVIYPDIIRNITTDPNTRPLFNLRRTIDDKGITRDVLYLIVPNMRDDVCRSSYPSLSRFGARAPIQEYSLEIASDNHHVVIDSSEAANVRGCVKTPNGTLYLFIKLISRFTTAGNTTWQKSQ